MTTEPNQHGTQPTGPDHKAAGVRRVVPVDEEQAPSTKETAQWGRKAVAAYAAEHATPQGSPDDPDVAEWIIRDIITDLCHYAAQLGLNPEYLADRGVGRYHDESRSIARSECFQLSEDSRPTGTPLQDCTDHLESEDGDRLPSGPPAAEADSPAFEDPHTAVADLAAARRELAWHGPEATNTATGAPHRITLNSDGTFTIRHNLGCYRYGGRRDTRTGELICDIDAYLDATDADDQPPPGDYWVIVEVFGRSEESVEAEWVPNVASPATS